MRLDIFRAVLEFLRLKWQVDQVSLPLKEEHYFLKLELGCALARANMINKLRT